MQKDLELQVMFDMNKYFKPPQYTLKVKFTLEQATKAQRESRCISILFL